MSRFKNPLLFSNGWILRRYFWHGSPGIKLPDLLQTAFASKLPIARYLEYRQQGLRHRLCIQGID